MNSRNNEYEIVRSIVGDHPNFVVDIGASDGTTWSNSIGFLRNGCPGMLAEYDEEKIPKLREATKGLSDITIVTVRVTPENICSLMALSKVPENFDFLSLDIDGYDYYVLEALLKEFTPKVICCEINIVIPPPFRFTVKFDPNWKWSGDGFFGMSISMAWSLLEPLGYALHAMECDNAVFCRHDECKPKFLETWKKGCVMREDPIDHYPRWPNYYQQVCIELMNRPIEYARKRLSKEWDALHAGQYILE